ncbi:MAG TPA: hypothetical protein VFM43_06870 [Gaiellaceae bacterium]|nr:hypothetical protein [Gaiellaceae bacterium]
MKRALVAAIGALAFAGLGATGALAGEVKGPPGVPCSGTDCIHNTNVTGALDHASSACAASGLNDMDPNAGQTSSIVQTAADSWRYYGMPHGTPGVACRGNLG